MESDIWKIKKKNCLKKCGENCVNKNTLNWGRNRDVIVAPSDPEKFYNLWETRKYENND